MSQFIVYELFGSFSVAGLKAREPSLRIDVRVPLIFSIVSQKLTDRMRLMNDKLSDYLISRVDGMEMKIERVEDKIDSLLQFKWQVVGGAITLSAIITFGFQFLDLISKHSK